MEDDEAVIEAEVAGIEAGGELCARFNKAKQSIIDKLGRGIQLAGMRILQSAHSFS